MKGFYQQCLLDVICSNKDQHCFATCHLGEVQGSGMHWELLLVKCTLRDEQLPFPAVLQL